MKTLNETLEIFLELTKKFRGAQPTFSINYQKNQIDLIYAPHGFLKLLFETENASIHLNNGVVSVEFFD